MQITLDPELQGKVRGRAAKIGIPVAEYVRRVLAAELGGAPPRADVSELFGLGDSAEPTHIAKDKHAMIADAIAADKAPR